MPNKNKPVGGSGKAKTKNKIKSRKQHKKPAKQKQLINKDPMRPIRTHKWSESREMKSKHKNNPSLPDFKTEFPETSISRGPDVSKINLKSTTSTSKTSKISKPEPEVKESLRDRMRKRLEAARFRQINEELDSSTNSNPATAFDSDPSLFKKYHEAYAGRMTHWPQNPLDLIIRWVKKRLSKDKSIVDFGCGEARLSSSVPNSVHSFDLFALNDLVTACDMSKVPLESGSMDAAVFCLSLMGTDVAKFIAEANRVLKINGLLKIAEVASRFSGNTYDAFLKRMKKFGFVAKQKGQKSHQSEESDVFLMFEFMKVRPVKNAMGKLPSLNLSPSVYKKR